MRNSAGGSPSAALRMVAGRPTQLLEALPRSVRVGAGPTGGSAEQADSEGDTTGAHLDTVIRRMRRSRGAGRRRSPGRVGSREAPSGQFPTELRGQGEGFEAVRILAVRAPWACSTISALRADRPVGLALRAGSVSRPHVGGALARAVSAVLALGTRLALPRRSRRHGSPGAAVAFPAQSPSSPCSGRSEATPGRPQGRGAAGLFPVESGKSTYPPGHTGQRFSRRRSIPASRSRSFCASRWPGSAPSARRCQ